MNMVCGDHVLESVEKQLDFKYVLKTKQFAEELDRGMNGDNVKTFDVCD